jgi:ABC-2 type transport system permease protein
LSSRIAAVARKEYRHIFRDPGTLGSLVFVPLFLLAIFGWAISLDVEDVPLLVRDYDMTAESRAFTSAFFASGRFQRVDPSVGPSPDRALDEGSASAVLEVPRGFSVSLGRSETAAVQVLVDGSDVTRAATIIGYIEGIVLRFGTERLTLRALQTGATTPSAIDARPRVLFNQDLRSINFLIPGLVALILVISAVVSTCLAIVREKELGSMEQLVVSPLRPAELIVGKTLPYASIGLVSASLVLGASALLFGVTVKGSLAELALMTILFVLACLALGILISTVTPSQQLAFMLSVMLTLLPTFLLSGFVFPLRNMPIPIQAIAYLFPTTYYLEILKALLVKGAGFASYWRDAAALTAYALVAGLAATARFARSRGK